MTALAFAALTFEAVACMRGGRVLFDGLSFDLAAGDAALVTGPNGAGKSSLARIAAGLLAPVAGEVRREGGCALLGESAALDPEVPLAKALDFWRRIDGQPEAAVGAALDAVALAPLADVPVRFLSTGQRRRAGLARVVASGAAIWLLDEPVSGLDAAAAAALEGVIAGHRAGGGIVLVATHQPLALPGAVKIGL